ncbi:nucleoside-diphosphate sugar epimerase/dehydratase [Pontibacterium granulatum]|uniref:polysaccharide biosynthesis protein n=1 Tax=Pontibacterium granulatum TaxID=2036029 RepID=UPI00249A1C38|nr:nucleoside-diphosphate sugar epimerase/dehydratase [Pontibacterium granulatum]MDI3323031.1 nucleoside-diphosphate sugar epimerase/dehydratase [Pontibacterium granulatum]
MKEQFNSAQQPWHVRMVLLDRVQKRLVMRGLDTVTIAVALWLAYVLRLADFWPTGYIEQAWWLFLVLPPIGVLVFTQTGLYRVVVRYMSTNAIWSILQGVALLALVLWASAFVAQIPKFPRSVPVNFALSAFVLIGGTRLLIRQYYQWAIRRYFDKEPVLIYGAGGAGAQLALALASGGELSAVGFLDDDKALWGETVAGLTVYNPKELGALIETLEITHVLLALPSVDRSVRQKVLHSLSDYSVHVKTVPSLPEIVSGEELDSLREVPLEDLLGRDPVPPKESLIQSSVTGKVVMISGAGGSIGAEIVRQVVVNKPAAVVLYEQSEFALYSIEREISQIVVSDRLSVPLFPVIGSVTDKFRVVETLRHFDVDTVYHAAAYKHVPLVEHNIFEGIRNNSLGTKVLAEAALEQGIERFILISTDKAVRPTNVMGATKRLAELVLQELATRKSKTTFSMVRFGNVLGSSGSVVPLFRKQIESKGPVTVTHPEITRFFMTIPEAASLVIQAGSMAKGGDVFVLDMGEPVKIEELARRMIHLMGLEVKSEAHPQGDIEIQFSGLRPGEKLYEELLIGEDVIGTEHPKIMRACEEMLSRSEIDKIFNDLAVAEADFDCELARNILQKAIKGFNPSSPVVDLLSKQSVSVEKSGALH